MIVCAPRFWAPACAGATVLTGAFIVIPAQAGIQIFPAN